MSEVTPVSIDIEDLIKEFADWKNGHQKAFSIVSSTLCLVSMISSCLIIRMMAVSKNRLTTTYHRLILGMSISDIIFSLSAVNFNAMVPRDMNYVIWNARGNEATCSAMGFFATAGAFCGIFYICSINLFYLAKVKYNKSDTYIRSRIEPFLHGVPILLALVPNFAFVAEANFNDSGGGGCINPFYDPPHCIGYEDGQVPKGFEIPCGRGKDGLPTLRSVSYLVGFLAPPVIVGVCLGMIYKVVWLQENRVARYGAGALRTNTAAAAAATDEFEENKAEETKNTLASSVKSAVSSWNSKFRKRSSSNSSQENSHSRAVMQRAISYSTAYFLTWIWSIVLLILKLAGAVEWNIAVVTNWRLALMYLFNIFTPLQGALNLLVYIQPQVIKEKQKSPEISWYKAFAKAFRSSVSSKESSTVIHANTDNG